MQWLIVLETENDPIPACRLINIFRRKGVKIVTLGLAAKAEAFSMVALVETPEPEVDHIFNFLRRTEGVRDVTCYRHETSGEPSYVFADTDADASSVKRILQAFPDARLIFAIQGKHFFEVVAGGGSRWAALNRGAPGILPFARFRVARGIPRQELVAVLPER